MEKIDIEKIKSAMPSRQFTFLIGGIVIVILAIFIITSHFGSNNSYSRGGAKGLSENSGTTVGDIVTQDSNKNGIPDWEESLWGLDPKADGATNKQLLASKKAAAGIVTTTDSTTPLTANDKFSRSLLTTILALQQSGNLTPTALENLAVSVGDNVDAAHVTVKIYGLSDLHVIRADDAAAKTAYMTGLKQILDQYSSLNLGSELATIETAFNDETPDAFAQLTPVAAAYTSISGQILRLPTPPSAAQYALDLANSSAAMGATLPQVQNFSTNVIGGMVGLDDFIKASNISDKASANMRAYFGFS